MRVLAIELLSGQRKLDAKFVAFFQSQWDLELRHCRAMQQSGHAEPKFVFVAMLLRVVREFETVDKLKVVVLHSGCVCLVPCQCIAELICSMRY